MAATAVKDATLDDKTVEYNGVQFGGSDGHHDIMPPELSLRGTMQYDDADRSVTHVNYTITVHTVIVGQGGDHGLTETQLEDMREKLSKPGKQLKLKGLGLGFEGKTNDPFDIVWGPKPRQIVIEPIAAQSNGAHELLWVCDFGIQQCASTQAGRGNPLALMAFNFDTSWSNDFEGQTTRRISGYAEIQGRRRAAGAGGTTPVAIASQARNNITIAIPSGFRRLSNDWNEDKSSRRLTFNVVDEQLNADPFPMHITQAEGVYGIETVPNAGFREGTANLAMQLTTAPGVDRSYALVPFFRAAFQKQRELRAAVNRSRPKDKEGMATKNKGTVIPWQFSMRHRLWSRQTSFSMTWRVAGCLQDVFFDRTFWEPVANTSWARWAGTMAALWGNTGNSNLQSTVADDVILDLCDGFGEVIIGREPKLSPGQNARAQLLWKCPDIPKDESWLGYRVRMEVLRREHTSWHRLAKAVGVTADTSAAPADKTKVPGGSYSTSLADEATEEQSGAPENIVVVSWKGLRIQHAPVPPALLTVGGKPVKQVGQSKLIAPYTVAQVGCHKVWFSESATAYYVPGGYVPAVEKQQDISTCGGQEFSMSQ